MFANNVVPRLYVKSKGEQVTKLALQLTTAPRKFAVRLTGGCGSMGPEDADGLYELFRQSFVGYDGVMLFGGTRMLRRDDLTTVVPGITEIPPALRALCPQTVLLGVIAKTQDLKLSDHGLIVSDDPADPFVTVTHPEQDIVLVVQANADSPAADGDAVWNAEYEECMAITEALRDFAGFRSVLVSYNGGRVTEREILATAARGWPVVLVRGSGRKTDEYAANRAWLDVHPHVAVAEKDPASIRQALARIGAMPERKITLVRGSAAG